MAPHIEKQLGELAKEDYLNPLIEIEVDAKLGDDDLNRKISILATRLARARKLL